MLLDLAAQGSRIIASLSIAVGLAGALGLALVTVGRQFSESVRASRRGETPRAATLSPPLQKMIRQGPQQDRVRKQAEPSR